MNPVRSLRPAVVTVLLAVPTLVAQAPAGTLVMGLRQEPTAPIPYLGPPTTGNADVTDQLFLRLATLGPTARTTGDRAMVPELASRWSRVDATTVDFTLDPRAHWQDGTPVTADDVVFTWNLIHSPELGVDLTALALIRSVTATRTGEIRVRFTEPSSEQVYTAGFLLQPLPAHLLARMPASGIASSDFARSPIGNGPFRFERRVPGQSLELRADPSFFLGMPGLKRLVFLYIPSTDAQVNALLAGQTDVMSDVPATALGRIEKQGNYRFVTAPGNFVTYVLFNARSPGNPRLAHPILSDSLTRRALALSVDRAAIARQAFGPGVQTPRAVRSQAWFWVGGAMDAGRADTARARAAFRAAGWVDHDGDGILDRDGVPLRLGIIYPVQSSVFSAIAVQLQQMWRMMGVQLDLEPIDGPVWVERRRTGRFDIDIAGANQDPSPSSLAQSWSCTSAERAGSSNVGHWCDPEFDRLRDRAPTLPDPISGFRAAFTRMAAWQPAIVAAAPANRIAVHQRFEHVIVRPSKAWTSLWQWRVRADAMLPRDR
ncbi:MAG TPA: peptide ABC transporter substrate-binding protein [Gemmatimonadales bacterium]|nr:peptide ABC transporter substrate-binding protein [Gemmatimonadales bacterium]